jgi:DNA-binding XRE family transcriptional regulator
MKRSLNVKLNPKENLLRQIRQALGMTQTEFADAIKATQRSIVRWEKGYTKPLFTLPQVKALQKEMWKIGLDFSDLPDDFN